MQTMLVAPLKIRELQKCNSLFLSPCTPATAPRKLTVKPRVKRPKPKFRCIC